MDFPALPAQPCPDPPDALLAGLGAAPREVLLAAFDYVAVYDNEDAVRAITPNLALLETLQSRGTVVTGPGNEVDFVSRYFAPAYGIPEDPVTGSTHSTLAPYWAARLGKTTLHARQISKRGGDLFCEAGDTRVSIAGRAALYLEGHISV